MTKEKNSDNHLKFKLKERIKELECLYAIAKINIKNTQQPINVSLEEAVHIIKKAWQYPDITEACILLDHHCISTKLFKDGIHFQESPLMINDIQRGAVKICYTKKMPPESEGPFLEEERSLINTLSQELSGFIERYENREEKKILEQKLRHSDRLATLGELIAGIAHELNEPLGSVLGFAELIQQEHQDDEILQSDISKIIKASIHAREVIRKLMLFSKYDEKENTSVNINTLLSDGLYLLENRCKKEDIKIIKILDKNLPSIMANVVQINQVIVNLIVNAIHAMPIGGNLILQTNFDNKSIYLIVQDNGAGIAENHIKKIFDPFFTTKETATSTGLGLSVVHGIIHSLNGKIEVESHLGTGTRFEISIPYF